MTETKRLRLGLMLPIGAGALGDGQPVRWADIREMARLGETIGLDTLLAPDHLWCRRQYRDRGPGGALAGRALEPTSRS